MAGRKSQSQPLPVSFSETSENVSDETNATLVSEADSSGIDWDSLGATATVVDENGESTDDTAIVNPPDKICPTCNGGIYREPGTRGRLPKYHPECRPSNRGSSGNSPRVIRVSKAAQVAAEEVELILESFAIRIQELVMVLSFVDAYDAMVISISAPKILNDLRPILLRYEKARAMFMAGQTGGSIFSVLLGVGLIALPIAAHHGAFGKRKVSVLLQNVPFIVKQMQDNAGENMTETLMAQVIAQAQAQNEARRKAETPNNGN